MQKVIHVNMSDKKDIARAEQQKARLENDGYRFVKMAQGYTLDNFDFYYEK